MMNIEIKEFTEACIAKGANEDSGNVNPKTDRQYYEIISSTYKLLLSNNRLEELLPLLEHENPYVQIWAAGYTLQIPDFGAEETLEDISKLKGVIGFTASITLQEWRKGALHF